MKTGADKRPDLSNMFLGNRIEETKKMSEMGGIRPNEMVAPLITDKIDDLVGKLLDEADEMNEQFESLTANSGLISADPGEVGKLAGRMNSSGATSTTGNKKPPTTNIGGMSATGRQGARSYGKVAGSESINMRGRDKVQEGQFAVPDQAGVLQEKKTADMQPDTSTGIGGKRVESDKTKFSLSDKGEWDDKMADRMQKPQAVNTIVERQGKPLDPRVAALLRETDGTQKQLIERANALRKELKNLYLPTDHLDDLLAQLNQNLEKLRENPGARNLPHASGIARSPPLRGARVQPRRHRLSAEPPAQPAGARTHPRRAGEPAHSGLRKRGEGILSEARRSVTWPRTFAALLLGAPRLSVVATALWAVWALVPQSRAADQLAQEFTITPEKIEAAPDYLTQVVVPDASCAAVSDAHSLLVIGSKAAGDKQLAVFKLDAAGQPSAEPTWLTLPKPEALAAKAKLPARRAVSPAPADPLRVAGHRRAAAENGQEARCRRSTSSSTTCSSTASRMARSSCCKRVRTATVFAAGSRRARSASTSPRRTSSSRTRSARHRTKPASPFTRWTRRACPARPRKSPPIRKARR